MPPEPPRKAVTAVYYYMDRRLLQILLKALIIWPVLNDKLNVLLLGACFLNYNVQDIYNKISINRDPNYRQSRVAMTAKSWVFCLLLSE